MQMQMQTGESEDKSTRLELRQVLYVVDVLASNFWFPELFLNTPARFFPLLVQ